MQTFACGLLLAVFLAVHASLRRCLVHNPAAQGPQMAYSACQWLIAVAVFWWLAILTPRLGDRYLPDDVLIPVGESYRRNETTTEFFFPLLPSWSDKQ